MKKKAPQPDCDTLNPLLIGIWRRFQKMSGPADVLQTREFRSVVEAVQTMQKGFESGNDYFQDKNILCLSALLLDDPLSAGAVADQ